MPPLRIPVKLQMNNVIDNEELPLSDETLTEIDLSDEPKLTIGHLSGASDVSATNLADIVMGQHDTVYKAKDEEAVQDFQLKFGPNKMDKN